MQFFLNNQIYLQKVCGWFNDNGHIEKGKNKKTENTYLIFNRFLSKVLILILN